MKKRFSDEPIINSFRKSETVVSARDFYRKHAILDATFYSCRKKYGGMEASYVKRRKTPKMKTAG